MATFQIFLILCFGFVGGSCFLLEIGKQGKRQATFERFDNTCGGSKKPVIFTYQGLRNEGSKLLINSTITVKEDIYKEPKVWIIIKRCKNKENLDTCEPFYDYNTDKCCTVLRTNSSLWTPFFGAYKPEFQCPFLKRIHKATDGELDVSALLLFPLDAWFWKVRIEVKDKETNRMLMCLIVEAHINSKS